MEPTITRQHRTLLCATILLCLCAGCALAQDVETAPDFKTVVQSTPLGTPVVALFSILGLGLLLGKLRIAGLSLGSSGVLFVALIFGHFGCGVTPGIGKVGLVLFVYCVGLTAGPSFFAAFARRGTALAQLSAIIVAIGTATAILCAFVFDISVDLTCGIFAGAMTSTPALASAMETLKDSPDVATGYGIAYPFGVIGVVLFVQLMPRLLKQDLDAAAAEFSSRLESESITRTLVEVHNPALAGKLIIEQRDFFDQAQCCVSRVMLDGRLTPVQRDTAFEIGQRLLLVGQPRHLASAIEHLGRKIEGSPLPHTDGLRMKVTVCTRAMLGRTICELDLVDEYGVTISRITRNGMTFVAGTRVPLEYGDTLTAVGQPDGLHRFAQAAGNESQALFSTNIVSLAIGITLGILLGMFPIPIPGLRAFRLGMAGGPLFVALLLGYFRRIGRFTSYMPQASRMLLMDLGLILFLASAGAKAGATMIPVLQQQGFKLVFAAAIITLVPMLTTYVIATKLFRMNILETLGGICGGMTSTPSLGVLASKVNSSVPVTSYATAYPVALILMTISAQLIVSLLT